MKPKCFSCRETMKVVYVRVDQVFVKIDDYYHCNNCKRTKRVAEQDIQISNIIVKNGILSLLHDSVNYSLNLRIHQYKLDFWVNDKKKEIIAMCKQYILALAGVERWLQIITKKGVWKTEFKDNGLVNIVLDDEETYRKYLTVVKL